MFFTRALKLYFRRVNSSLLHFTSILCHHFIFPTADNHVDGISSPDIKRPPVSHAAVGSLVSIGVISLVVIGVILLVRRCPWNQGSTSGSYVCDPVSNSYTFQLNHLGGEHSTQKYLSRHERRGGHVKSTNLHMCTSSSKSNAKLTSSSGLYERNRPTGASSMSSDHVSSSNSSYPKETLNPRRVR